jgi:hypothetical protein
LTALCGCRRKSWANTPSSNRRRNSWPRSE